MDVTGKMPVLFTGHGSPMNAIGDNRARSGWKKMGEYIGKPNVIIAISAHWTTRGLYVRTAADNPQINDMYGFPPELYEVHYEPMGSPEFASAVMMCLAGRAKGNNSWGIDHGVWSVLSNMYPDADVPVVMVSTDATADAQTQYEIGKSLRAMRSMGALIVASGNVVHNLRMVNWDMDKGYDWADSFDGAVKDAILNGDFKTPVEYENIEFFEKAIPTVEHYYPLLNALGAAEPGSKVTVWK